MPTDLQRATWLKSDALYEVVTDSTAQSRWGSFAVTRKSVTALAYAADALAEAARQVAFFSVPMAIDVHEVPGDQRQWLGRKITLKVAAQGYDNGKDVIVIGADHSEADDATQLRVLVRL